MAQWLVSDRKTYSFVEDGLEVDVSYIKPNIIAVGCPLNKKEKRNYINAILSFLVEKHEGHCKIHNLCWVSEKLYDPGKFEYLVARYPLSGDNVPPFTLIINYCEEMDKYLGYDEENVAIVHGMGDDGGTEVMICAYLVHKRYFESPKEALEYYDDTKTSDRKNVTTPSQRRYVYYYAHLRRHDLNYKPTLVLLTGFVMENIPSVKKETSSFSYSICQSESESQATAHSEQTYAKKEATSVSFQPSYPLPLNGDIQVQFYYHGLIRKELVFQFWFNTFFVSGLESSEGEASMQTQSAEIKATYRLVEGTACLFELQKKDLEKVNKNKENEIFSSNFKLVVNFIVPYTKQDMDNLQDQHTADLERERKSHKHQTSTLRNRLAESEKETSQKEKCLRKLRQDVQQKDAELKTEKYSKTQVEKTLVSTRRELQTLDAMKLKAEEDSAERLRILDEECTKLRQDVQQKDAELKTEKYSKTQVEKTLVSTRRELRLLDAMKLKAEEDSAERLRILNEEYTTLRQQHEESESALRLAQESIEQYQRDWTIPRHEIEISEKELGRGGWGWVKKGKFRGTKVAVKQMHGLIVSDYTKQIFVREMKIAAKCRHPNLLQFIGATNDNGVPLFVTELMDTDLRTVLYQRKLRPDEVIAFSLDVNLALNYLHLADPPIVHRDISSANVLLWKQEGKEWRAKLSDYGSANLIQECKTACPGAPIYAAPEARTSTQQSPKMDVYSSGVLLCEMWIRKLPNPECLDEQILSMTNKDLRRLVRQCTNRSPENRPTTHDVVSTLQGLNV